MKLNAAGVSLDYGKPAKLDEKDWEILRLLSKNARMPISAISRKSGLPRDVVKYRLKRLIDEKVISHFLTLTNFPKLGYSIFGFMHLSFKDLTVKREKELIDFVVKDPYVVFAHSTLGSWDFGIEFFARDLSHFYVLQKEIKEKFADIIKEIETGSYVTIHKINYVPYRSGVLK
ncbi:MAG TPA: Lrp/AsnC family transcriptional regulator [Candidatus Norongarragalinales archaeon]|nr:Lrp/AsnC family transcriptional regulator [Candidatus Norongarragalinales archaeon]